MRLAEAHRLAQHRLGIETMGVLRRVSPALDLTALDATTPEWLRLVTPIVAAQHRRSAQLAGGYIEAARALDVGPTDYIAPIVPFDVEQVVTSMRVMGPVEARRLTAAGMALADVRRGVRERSASAGVRLALAGGRGSIMGSVPPGRRGPARRQLRVAPFVRGAPPCFGRMIVAPAAPALSTGGTTGGPSRRNRCATCGVKPRPASPAVTPSTRSAVP